MTTNGTAVLPPHEEDHTGPVIIAVVFDRPLYNALADYAAVYGHREDTIVREAVRSYLGLSRDAIARMARS